MRLALFGLAASAVLALGAGSASAQPYVYPAAAQVYVGPAYPPYPAYAPGVAVGGTIVTPGGLAVSGVYGARGVGVALPYAPYPPVVRVGGYYGPSYYPHHHNHHRYGW